MNIRNRIVSPQHAPAIAAVLGEQPHIIVNRQLGLICRDFTPQVAERIAIILDPRSAMTDLGYSYERAAEMLECPARFCMDEDEAQHRARRIFAGAWALGE
jgi:hypothetical protein